MVAALLHRKLILPAGPLAFVHHNLICSNFLKPYLEQLIAVTIFIDSKSSN